jgi:chorismate mutase
MNKSEALKLLNDSRDKIDQIDDEIFNLIIKRTSLSKGIVTAKMVLGKDIHDTRREDYIQDKIKTIAKKKNINEVSLINIMNILTDLNKNEQEKFSEGKNNGKH